MSALLSYQQLSAELDVKRGTLKRWKHDGMPARVLEGGRVRFDRSEVGEWIVRRQTEPNKLRRLRKCTFGRSAVVYFGRGRGGLVKIGWSSDADRREAEVDCEIAATVVGDKNLEGSFHRVFAADHVEGEWFRPSPRLLGFIYGLARMS